MPIQARLAAFASGIGLTGLAIAILAALLAVQTVRLEGLSVWPLSIEGARPKAERLQRDLDNVKAAQEVALERAEAAKAKAENNYRRIAERIDDEHEQAQSGALADAAEYIRTHRVRCQASGSAGGGTLAAAGDNSPGISEALPGAGELDGAVAVSEDDVRACTVNTIQANAAREWALELEEASR